jgi:hypothetical protein
LILIIIQKKSSKKNRWLRVLFNTYIKTNNQSSYGDIDKLREEELESRLYEDTIYHSIFFCAFENVEVNEELRKKLKNFNILNQIHPIENSYGVLPERSKLIHYLNNKEVKQYPRLISLIDQIENHIVFPLYDHNSNLMRGLVFKDFSTCDNFENYYFDTDYHQNLFYNYHSVNTLSSEVILTATCLQCERLKHNLNSYNEIISTIEPKLSKTKQIILKMSRIQKIILVKNEYDKNNEIINKLKKQIERIGIEVEVLDEETLLKVDKEKSNVTF